MHTKIHLAYLARIVRTTCTAIHCAAYNSAEVMVSLAACSLTVLLFTCLFVAHSTLHLHCAV